MEFFATELLSDASSSTLDGTVRATRSASFSGSAVRKNFSSVLQGVRSEEKTGSAQEVEASHGPRKAEDRSNARQSKGLNPAASQTERSEVTQTRPSTSDKLNDDQTQTIDSSREESEPAMPQDHSGSVGEGEIFLSMTSASVLQAGAHPMVSRVPQAHNDRQVSDCECSPTIASSSAPVVTDASVRPTEGHPSEKGAPGLPPDKSEQAAELVVSKGENDLKGKTTVSVLPQATFHASLSGEAASSSDETALRMVQSPDGKLLPESQFDRKLVALDRGEDSAAHHPTENQAPLLVPAPDEQGDRGTRTQGIPTHGQQLTVEQAGPFSQSGHDHEGRQQGNPESKVFQGTVVDLQSMDGRTTEHYAAVAQNQTIHVTAASSPTVAVPVVHPASSVADPTQQPVPSLLRSVVLNVVQPDLGHVNIRVAMMNDAVHAHFSTDRAEVGQFLINGQDRLQTTLQANGLEMGQFRVDIDRQNGGRSFHQGLFQEQGQSGHQGFPGMAKEQAQGWSDDIHRQLQGRLNVVA